jgi:hypothetical protein
MLRAVVERVNNIETADSNVRARGPITKKKALDYARAML